MTELLQRILPTVQKPARYVGGEYRQVVKEKDKTDVLGSYTGVPEDKEKPIQDADDL